MITTPTPWRRTYDAVALFAVLNVAAALGLIGYLIASGTITGDRLRAMMEYVRTAEQAPVAEDANSEGPAVEGLPAGGQESAPAPVGLTAEIMRRESGRIKAELDQRLALNNSILLRITKEREAFDREREQEASRAAALKDVRGKVGFSKQVAIFEALAPKIAVQHLLSIPDPVEAARMLVAIDTRRAKKIIEAAKKPEDSARMRTILRTVRDVTPEGSTELGAEQ